MNVVKKADYHKTKLACYMGFITQAIAANFTPCIWRILTAGFAEQNGRNAKLNGRITFDY